MKYRTRPTVLILYSILLCTSIGCAQNTGPADSELVPDSIMAEIFIEFHLLEARTDLYNQDIIALRDSVMLHHGVDTVSYERTMEYYSNNPELYMQVYSDALDRLSDERYMPNDN